MRPWRPNEVAHLNQDKIYLMRVTIPIKPMKNCSDERMRMVECMGVPIL